MAGIGTGRRFGFWGKKKLWAAAFIVLAVVLVGSAGYMLADEKQQTQKPAPVQGGLPDLKLTEGLKATPGCLGVEGAQTAGGKQVIFAWFEDKKACLKWYYSETHARAQKAFFPDRPGHKPLAGVPDDVGPIMVVASLTMSDKSHFEATGVPISQISIELYKPLPGGLFLGSTFAPATLKVPGMVDYTPKEKK